MCQRSAAHAQFKDSRVLGDKRGMRVCIQVIALALCLSFSSGCIVLDEVDKAHAQMGIGEKSKDDPKPAEIASAAAASKNQLLEQSREWWDRATSLGSETIDSSIVNCRFGGSTQFMSKNDCLTRGGSPKGVAN
jgi:hypothetical protein